MIDSSRAVDAGDLGRSPDAQPRSRDPVTELDHGLVHAGGFSVEVLSVSRATGLWGGDVGPGTMRLNLVVRRVSGTGAVCP